MEDIACFYNIKHFHERVPVYTCGLLKRDIICATTFSGEHFSDRVNADVRGVALAHCTFPSGFPRNLAVIFPNLDHIAINGGLTAISKDDLSGFENLKFLDLQGCEISSLADDVFENTPNLEVIYFSFNQLSTIGPNLLEPLKKLKYIDLSGNANIDAVYDEDKADILSLDDLKNMIRVQCGVQNAVADNFVPKSRVSGAK